MTDFHATISGYDVLDSVVYVVRVYDLDRPAGPLRLALDVRQTTPGVGESDALVWTSQLVAQLAAHLEQLRASEVTNGSPAH